METCDARPARTEKFSTKSATTKGEPLSNPPPQASTPLKRIYASVAGATVASLSTYAPNAPIPRRFAPPLDSHSVLLRPKRDTWLEKVKDNAQELFRLAKQEVAQLVGAVKLRNGCIRLSFSTEKAKKTALSQDLREKFKSYVLEEDFPVEVIAVRTSLFKFRYGDESGRVEAVERIQEMARKTLPNARVTRASWIHGRKT